MTAGSMAAGRRRALQGLTLLPSGVDARMVPSRINVFAREYIRDGQEAAPRLVFFQGGPGSAAPRMAPIGSWLDAALNHYRVVLVDERGTGNSHPLEKMAVTSVGTHTVSLSASMLRLSSFM